MGTRSDGKTSRTLRGIPFRGRAGLCAERSRSDAPRQPTRAGRLGDRLVDGGRDERRDGLRVLALDEVGGHRAVAGGPAGLDRARGRGCTAAAAGRGSGPTVATVPAAASVWQFLTAAPPNRSRPCFWSGVRLLTLAEGIESRLSTVAITAAGTPMPRIEQREQEAEAAHAAAAPDVRDCRSRPSRRAARRDSAQPSRTQKSTNEP